MGALTEDHLNRLMREANLTPYGQQMAKARDAQRRREAEMPISDQQKDEMRHLSKDYMDEKRAMLREKLSRIAITENLFIDLVLGKSDNYLQGLVEDWQDAKKK